MEFDWNLVHFKVNPPCQWQIETNCDRIEASMGILNHWIDKADHFTIKKKKETKIIEYLKLKKKTWNNPFGQIVLCCVLGEFH